MGKQLVITEKPSVARDVAAALGGFQDQGEYLESEDYVVTWALGHLLELAEPQDYDAAWKSWSIKNLPIIPENFQIRPRDGQKKRLDLIKKLGARKDVDGVINACDAGREGEMIYRRIAEYTGLDAKPQRRLWMQSMTKAAIKSAFDALRPGAELDALADAAWLRGVGDWLIGMNATRALTQRLKSGGELRAWSAGRVQTPTLKLLVDREREILDHVPRPYWEIQATFTHEGPSGAQEWTGRWVDPNAPEEGDKEARPTRIFDAARAESVLRAVQAASRAPARERRRKSVQKPPALFDLTTLQREANRRYGISAKRTLDAAQRLYEGHKVLTYPRTDARTLPDDYGPTVLAVLDALGAMNLVDGDASSGQAGISATAQRVVREGPQNLDKVLDSSGVTDHFAIVPTGTAPAEELSGDDARVFDLVVRQFLAALMGPATWAVVERHVDVPAEQPGRPPESFRTNAKSLEIAGFMEALGVEEGSGSQLPPLVPGQDAPDGVPVGVKDPVKEDKHTRPPARFNEGQLLRMMETAGESIEEGELSEAMRGRGMGTPATRANIIEELVKKGYARRIDKRLAPTSKAIRLMDILDRVDVKQLASPRLTGEWEHTLSRVERGEVPKSRMLGDLVEYTRDVVQHLVGFDHATLYAGTPSLGVCPACGGQVYESAWGYACERNTGRDSACSFIIWKDRGGRYMDRKLVARLLADRRVPDVDGFVSLSGQPQTATLALAQRPVDVKRGKETVEELRWVVDLDYGTGAPGSTEAEVEEGVLGPCPVYPDSEIVVTNQRYVTRKLLDGREKKGPVLPRVVCQRELTPEEVAGFFAEEGKTAILEGFISRRGRPFKGQLIRKPTGKHGFEFPPREPRGKRGAADGKEAPPAETKPRKATGKAGKSAAKPAAKKPSAAKASAAKPAAEAGAKKPAAKASAKKPAAAKAKSATGKKGTAAKSAPAAPEPEAASAPARAPRRKGPRASDEAAT